MRILDFSLSPQEAAVPELWQQVLRKAAQTAETPCARILRESIDARSRQGVRFDLNGKILATLDECGDIALKRSEKQA